MSIDLTRWADAIVGTKSEASIFAIDPGDTTESIFTRDRTASNKTQGNTMNIMTAETEFAIGPVIPREPTKCPGTHVMIALETGHSDRIS